MTAPVNESISGLEKWLQQELSNLIGGPPVGPDALKYILSMGSVEEVEDYISDLVGKDSEKREQRERFFSQLHLHWQPTVVVGTPVTPPTTSASAMGRKRAPPPGLEKNPQNVYTEVTIRHCIASGSEGDATGKGDSPQGGAAVRNITLGATAKGNPPPGLAAKGNPLPKQPSAYMKPKHDDLAYVPASATQKKETQHKGSGGHHPSRQPLANSSGRKLHNDSGDGPKGNSQKKQKYVTLTSAEGQNRMTMCFPGRHTCECLAQKHPLVNNCTECGRIVCEQEGVGPCVTCGALVCTPEEQALLRRDSKKASKLRESLMRQWDIKVQSGTVTEGLKGPQLRQVEARNTLVKAVDHKDKLLEFDRTSKRQTKVIDDESDYFSTESNRWISDTERESLQQREAELREIRHGSRLNRKLTVDLDFAGRRVLEEVQVNDMYDERHVEDIMKSEGQQSFYMPPAHNAEVDEDSLINPTIEVHPPIYIPTVDTKKKCGKGSSVNAAGPVVLRIQDRPLQEMRDEGKCLSMHQPWASLLVLGIKKVEGRSWYTAHRGRLWIASAKYLPSGEEIAAVEQQYRDLYNEPNLAFPDSYPSGQLLGAVDIVDCLTQEDFQAQYNSSESQSPYVMIVSNPQHLSRHIPVQGQHKIWQLPSDVHTKARKLMQVPNSRTTK